MTSSTVTSTTVTSTTGTWSTTRSSSTTTSPTATTSTTKTETKTTTTMTTTTTTNMMSDEQSQKVDTNETEEEGLGVDDEDEGVNAADFFGLSGTGSDMGEVGSDVGTVTKSFVGGVVVALIAQFAITQLDDYT
ncbi:unnamed protein product [Amoebophrya sp. A25]|nr:unnamed protein product [Amoebophrya sp. A25]|eukprot:GSA25T00025075001.1